jgi:CheY-like chemotaxis protein
MLSEGVALVVASVLGWDFDKASDGNEALAKTKTKKYSLILMNCDIAQMDGFEFAAKLRKSEKGSGRRTPIICMIESASAFLRKACLAAGVDDYVDKACTHEELAKMLVKWVCRASSDVN